MHQFWNAYYRGADLLLTADGTEPTAQKNAALPDTVHTSGTGNSSDSDADDAEAAWPLPAGSGSSPAAGQQVPATAAATHLQQWTGVCIVPLKAVRTASPHEIASASPPRQTLGVAASLQLDAATEEPQQAHQSAEVVQIGQQLPADQGPVTRAKCAKRHSEPLYSLRSSPTKVEQTSADSHATGAQQRACEQLLHNPAVPGHSSPQTAAAAAAAAASNGDGSGREDAALEQLVDWGVVEAWLSTPEGGVALEWEGLDPSALNALLQVSPSGCKHGQLRC